MMTKPTPDDELNTYWVVLCVQTGGYEKQSYTLVTAPNEDKAYLVAVYSERHNDLTEDDGSWIDGAYDFVYSPTKCTEVDVCDIPTLKKYNHVFEYDCYLEDLLVRDDE